MSCAHHKTPITGTIDVVEEEWCAIEVEDANNTVTWIKLNKRKLRHIKEGDKVTFYVKVESSDL
jgi:hypothetical protein